MASPAGKDGFKPRPEPRGGAKPGRPAVPVVTIDFYPYKQDSWRARGGGPRTSDGLDRPERPGGGMTPPAPDAEAWAQSEDRI